MARITARACGVAMSVGVVLAVSPLMANAACPDASVIEAAVRDWHALTPLRGIGAGLSFEDGLCARERFVAALARTQGRVVGYKAGLTNPVLQQRFGHDQPLRGTLFERMLLPDGAQVPVRYGARPVVEADLLVEVADDAIMSAATRLEVLRSLSRVLAFIELADLVLAEGETVTAAAIAAINVGARLGVVGGAVNVEATPAFGEALARMRVVVSDESGAELVSAPGSAILGHPLDAVLWLVRDLERAGVRLKRGDLLSLGAFAPPLQPRAGTTLTVRYLGLPGSPAVSVTFR